MSIRETITATVRARLIDGTYAPGSQLPSLADLSREFCCSTATAVYAMRALAEEGYLVSRPGVGYYAAQALPSRPTDESAAQQEAQRAIVASLRREARRLQEIADRLDRTIADPK